MSAHSLVTQMVKNCLQFGRSWVQSLGKSPGGGHGKPLQHSCLEKPHGQQCLVGYRKWDLKESDTTVRLSTEQCMLVKVMTAYSSIPDWKIPWTEEPGGLQSTWLQRAGHDWSNLPQCISEGLPWWLSIKQFACNAGDACRIVALGSGRSPGKGNGNPLQYPCLENPIAKGAWWTIVHGLIKESDMT